ncbi:50S ribosomal protein L24 [Candidatus Mycoplasma haematohominis]|uniref:Large ribosomal subunit protein uL24 n=1 Tax=Candidatus Mycoplasma haematohominis TaxID=1494318 RepID=A0A478FUG1_9MOLU|nr:50S ribosomal protein L24 [Candidatus Mycoplasma haemohominis]GCE63966.1 50S ribosomal protein L24 [Candidatus Mycoplasma haemohominis]
MRRIIKKDKVKVISGRYKGSVGTVLEVLVKENRVLVEGVNKVRKCIKNSKSSENYQEKEAPIHISNVALIDAKTEKPIKVGYMIKDGKKIRVNRKTKEEIPRNF